MCHLDTVLFLLQNWSKISCKKFTLTLTDLRMTQKALSQTMVTRDGRRIVTRWLSMFFSERVRFLLLSWKKLSLTTSHWELDVLTLKISNVDNQLSSDCTHLWNDAVILELLLQQSVFLLQCLNLVKSILTNIATFVKF